MQDKFSKIATIIISVFVLILGTTFAVMGYLSQIKIDIFEKVYLFHTNKILFGAAALFCVILVCVIVRFSEKIKLNANLVFGISLGIGLLWVLVSQMAPTDDADHCMKIAEELVDGITHSFDPGQYMDVWRQQNFLVLYMCLLKIIGGMYNYVLFQIINAVCFAWMCREIYAFLNKKSAMLANSSMIIMLLYTPIWMSVTYVYGNLIGMALGIIALIKQYDYLENNKIKDAIWSAVLIGFAIAFKMFVLIFLITMIIMYIWKMIVDKKITPAIWIILCVLMYWGVGKAANITMDVVSNSAATKDGGMPMSASLVMGLDIDEEMTNPGWYNAYNIETYFANDNKKAETSQTNKEDLKRVISEAFKNPISYIRAHYRKAHTVWNDPSFDVLYRMRVSEKSQIDTHPNWYNSLMADSGRLHRVLLLFIQALQTVIYFGVILFSVRAIYRKKYYDLMGLIAFIGGVMFISFWEAKSEYVMPYFLPLIAYAVSGYDSLLKTALEPKDKSFVKQFFAPLSICLVTVVVTLIFIPRADNEQEWNTYINEHYYVSADNYELSANGNTPDIAKNVYIDFDPVFITNWAYKIYDNAERYYFIFQNWDEIDMSIFDRTFASEDNVLTIADDETINGDFARDHWVITRRSGGYLIKMFGNENKVWTYDPNTNGVILADYEEGNPNQIWAFK